MVAAGVGVITSGIAHGSGQIGDYSAEALP
jgi:hypothetical protein